MPASPRSGLTTLLKPHREIGKGETGFLKRNMDAFTGTENGESFQCLPNICGHLLLAVTYGEMLLETRGLVLR